jgi:hypothetical protein
VALSVCAVQACENHLMAHRALLRRHTAHGSTSEYKSRRIRACQPSCDAITAWRLSHHPAPLGPTLCIRASIRYLIAKSKHANTHAIRNTLSVVLALGLRSRYPHGGWSTKRLGCYPLFRCQSGGAIWRGCLSMHPQLGPTTITRASCLERPTQTKTKTQTSQSY